MSQRGLILRLLREAGPTGVDAHELVYVHGITQVAARIWELRTQFGHEIETIDRGTAPDGRRRLCTYVLKDAEGTQPPAPIATDPSPTPVPLRLPCGCVRAADGMSWESRCERHRPGDAPAGEAVRW